MNETKDVYSVKPIISTIIATKNRASLLRRALESLTWDKETLPWHEVVVVDGMSTDNTPDVLDRAKQKIPLLRSLRCRDNNQTEARQRGLDVSCGKYVAFLDDDDICLWRTTLAVEYLEQHPEIYGVVGDYYVFTEPEFDFRFASLVKTPPLSFERVLERNPIACGSVVVRNGIDVRFETDLTYGEEWELWLRLLSKHRLGQIHAPFYAYHFGPGGRGAVWSRAEGEQLRAKIRERALHSYYKDRMWWLI